jgi:hypothetical protein
MQAQPSVIASGDFLYFAPEGKAFNIPAPGVVSNAAKPDPTDPLWSTYLLGTVGGSNPVTQDKRTSKEVMIKAPTITGTIVPTRVLRPEHELTMEVTMNEISRTALAAFYKSPLIETGDTTFYPLSSQALRGWLKRQRYSDTGLWIVDDWYVDVDVTEFTVEAPNVYKPKFKFTWLAANPSTLNVSSI